MARHWQRKQGSAFPRQGNSKGGDRPDGWYHGVITCVLAAPITVGALFAFGPSAALFAFLGCMAQLVLDPDLDQPGVTAAEWRVFRIPLIGRVVGSFWLAWTTLYSMVFNHRNGSRVFRHRGISHWPVVGTMTRVLFFLCPCWVGYNVITGRLNPIPLEAAVPFIGAMVLCDLGHWARDKLS